MPWGGEAAGEQVDGVLLLILVHQGDHLGHDAEVGGHIGFQLIQQLALAITAQHCFLAVQQPLQFAAMAGEEGFAGIAHP